MSKLKGNHLNILITGLVTWFLAMWLAWALDSLAGCPSEFFPLLGWILMFAWLPILMAQLLVRPRTASVGYSACFMGLLFNFYALGHSFLAGEYWHAGVFAAFFLVPVAMRLLVDWALSPFVEFRELTAEDGIAGRMEQRIRRLLRS